MKLLSRAEEIILITILKLQGNAYGVSIREQIHKDTGVWWSFASIYTPLDKLNRKKYVQKTKGDSLPERGGKSKYLYSITESGKEALKVLRYAYSNVWSDIPDAALE